MARYQLILAYDGTDFSGFQRQGETRTVQKVVENALVELGWRERILLFAGRTDAGVHATGQVVSFNLEWQHPDSDLSNALNAKLPEDISVQAISRVEAEFHPRYDASNRKYVYTIYHSPVRNPLRERYAWRIWPILDGERLEGIARLFLGTHDFSRFGRAMKPGSSTIREVFESKWTQTNMGCRYEICANAFLYHMVRRLVFVQVEAARGTMILADFRESFSGIGNVKSGLAPASGLVLESVSYSDHQQGYFDEEEN
jgi:tRNA pseudouridine38-40 synthase